MGNGNCNSSRNHITKTTIEARVYEIMRIALVLCYGLILSLANGVGRLATLRFRYFPLNPYFFVRERILAIQS